MSEFDSTPNLPARSVTAGVPVRRTIAANKSNAVFYCGTALSLLLNLYGGLSVYSAVAVAGAIILPLIYWLPPRTKEGFFSWANSQLWPYALLYAFIRTSIWVAGRLPEWLAYKVISRLLLSLVIGWLLYRKFGKGNAGSSNNSP